jgi:hypothetical protein
LTENDDVDVKWISTSVLGSIFVDVPDDFNKEALGKLLDLTIDKSLYVCMEACYSLGKICIEYSYKLKDKYDMIELLENAIRYLEWFENQISKFEPPIEHNMYCGTFWEEIERSNFKKFPPTSEIRSQIDAAKDRLADIKMESYLQTSFNLK